eukprot:313084-Chlamydomonas_euryale.AAC.3
MHGLTGQSAILQTLCPSYVHNPCKCASSDSGSSCVALEGIQPRPPDPELCFRLCCSFVEALGEHVAFAKLTCCPHLVATRFTPPCMAWMLHPADRSLDATVGVVTRLQLKDVLHYRGCSPAFLLSSVSTPTWSEEKYVCQRTLYVQPNIHNRLAEQASIYGTLVRERMTGVLRQTPGRALPHPRSACLELSTYSAPPFYPGSCTLAQSRMGPNPAVKSHGYTSHDKVWKCMTNSP